MEEKSQKKAVDLIEAMTLYITSMKQLEKYYEQAKADIEEMFRARVKGIYDEADTKVQ